MVPELSRRRLLAGGLAAAGLAGAGATTRIGVGALDTWTPSFGTWPQDRYDLANTAANPHARPPEDPSVAWRARPVERVQSVVVGPERVYVGGEIEAGGPGVAALRRDDGGVVWRVRTDGETLALRRGTLYAGSLSGESPGVTAFDAESGERLWNESVGRVAAIAVADGTVFAGSYYQLSALDAGSGRRKWDIAGGRPAVADGALFASRSGARRYRPRRVSDVATGAPPPVAWDAIGGGQRCSPVVTGDRVVVGQELPWEGTSGSVYAFDRATGEREWTGVERPAEESLVITGSPAVRYEKGFLSFRRGKQEERRHAVVACSLADGAERWRWSSTDWVTTVVVGGETVLAGTSADDDTPGEPRHRVVALSLDGRRRWAFDATGDVRAVASVARTVFVGTEPASDATGERGRVYALR